MIPNWPDLRVYHMMGMKGTNNLRGQAALWVAWQKAIHR